MKQKINLEGIKYNANLIICHQLLINLNCGTLNHIKVSDLLKHNLFGFSVSTVDQTKSHIIFKLRAKWKKNLKYILQQNH